MSNLFKTILTNMFLAVLAITMVVPCKAENYVVQGDNGDVVYEITDENVIESPTAIQDNLLPEVANVQVTDQFVVTCDEFEGASKYRFKLYLNGEQQGASWTSFRTTMDSLRAYVQENGEYYVTVTALDNDYNEISKETSSRKIVLSGLSSVKSPDITYDKDNACLLIENVDNYTEFFMEVYSYSDKKGGYWKFSDCTFDTQKILDKYSAGDFRIQITAISSDLTKYLSSSRGEFMFNIDSSGITSKEKLPAPSSAVWDDSAMTLRAKFGNVMESSTKLYTIELMKNNESVFTEIFSFPNATNEFIYWYLGYHIEKYGDGTYTYRVKANATDDKSESDWTYSNEFVYKKPSNKLDTPRVYWDGTTIKWDAVDNASGYSYELYENGKRKQSGWINKNSISYENNLTDGNTYTVHVQALSKNINEISCSDIGISPEYQYGNTALNENGWNVISSTSYWYEGGVKQGTYDDPKGVIGDGTVRGREIYDPVSDGWYWLDSCYDGAKACSKEVWMPYIYQNEKDWQYDEIEANASNSGSMSNQVIDAIQKGLGKWVRYDANGKMYKGWYTVEGDDAAIYPSQKGNTYYYDPMTGLMAKGHVTIDGKTYHFDEITGALEKKSAQVRVEKEWSTREVEPIIETYFYEDGKKEKEIHYDSPKKEAYTIYYTYDSNDKLVLYETKSPDNVNNTSVSNKYDSNGEVSQQTVNNGVYGTTIYYYSYVYDSQKNIMEKYTQTDYMKKNNISPDVEKYKYDSRGNIIEKQSLSNNIIIYTYTYSYDDNNNLLYEELKTNGMTQLSDHKITFTYKDDKIIKRVYTEYGVSTETNYEYDEFGRVNRETVSSPNGSSSCKWTYECDAYGNVLNEKKYREDNSELIYERTLTYY